MVTTLWFSIGFVVFYQRNKIISYILININIKSVIKFVCRNMSKESEILLINNSSGRILLKAVCYSRLKLIR